MSLEVQPLIDSIRAYCETEGITLNRLSGLAGVGQPALHRFVAGERKTVTAVAAAVRAYMDSRHKPHKVGMQGKLAQKSHPEGELGRGVIDEAVRAQWDGTPRSAALIAALINAVAPVIAAANNQ